MAFLYAVDYREKGKPEWVRAKDPNGNDTLIGCHQRAHIEVDAKNPDFPYEVRFYERNYS